MGDVKDQRMHPLVLAPKVPGRFYFLFGKPIETRGTNSKTLHYILSICILEAFSVSTFNMVTHYVGYR